MASLVPIRLAFDPPPANGPVSSNSTPILNSFVCASAPVVRSASDAAPRQIDLRNGRIRFLLGVRHCAPRSLPAAIISRQGASGEGSPDVAWDRTTGCD